MDLSVIIVTHNTKKLTLECIHSVYTQSRNLSLEVILVDNASTDGTFEQVSLQFPNVIYVRNTVNYSFPKANNLALGLCSGKYVLLLNSDTIVLDSALETMFMFMESNPSAGICGAKMLDERLHPWRYETWQLTPMSYLLNSFLMRFSGDIGTKQVDWVCGACLMIKSSIIEQVGVLDNYMYGEDMDWCLRTKNAGWQVWHLGKAKIIHYWGKTGSSSDRLIWRVCIGRTSKLYYTRKHLGTASYNALRIIMLFECMIKIPLYMLRVLILPDSSGQNFSMARGHLKLMKTIFLNLELDDSAQLV